MHGLISGIQFGLFGLTPAGAPKYGSSAAQPRFGKCPWIEVPAFGKALQQDTFSPRFACNRK